MKALIIDDEPLAHDIILTYIKIENQLLNYISMELGVVLSHQD